MKLTYFFALFFLLGLCAPNLALAEKSKFDLLNLGDCAELLAAVRDRKAEVHLVGTAKSVKDKAELFDSYGAVFSEIFEKSVRAAMLGRGIKMYEKWSRWDIDPMVLVRFSRDAGQLIKSEPEERRHFAYQVFLAMKTVSEDDRGYSGHGAETEALYKLLSAIDKSSHRFEYIDVLWGAIEIYLSGQLVSVSKNSSSHIISRLPHKFWSYLLLSAAGAFLVNEHIPSLGLMEWVFMSSMAGNLGVVFPMFLENFFLKTGLKNRAKEAEIRIANPSGPFAEYAMSLEPSLGFEYLTEEDYQEKRVEVGRLSAACGADLCGLTMGQLTSIGHLDELDLSRKLNALELKSGTDGLQIFYVQLTDEIENLMKSESGLSGEYVAISQKIENSLEGHSKAKELASHLDSLSTRLKNLEIKIHKMDARDLGGGDFTKLEIVFSQINRFKELIAEGQNRISAVLTTLESDKIRQKRLKELIGERSPRSKSQRISSLRAILQIVQEGM